MFIFMKREQQGALPEDHRPDDGNQTAFGSNQQLGRPRARIRTNPRDVPNAKQRNPDTEPIPHPQQARPACTTFSSKQQRPSIKHA
jgi:hypothetical protein